MFVACVTFHKMKLTNCTVEDLYEKNKHRIQQGQEDQGAGVTDVEMLLNISTDGAVTVGASLSVPFEKDDALVWEGSNPKVIIMSCKGVNALLTSWQPLLTQIS